MSTQSSTPLGFCGRVTNKLAEELCGNAAVSEVLVKTKFDLMTVLLCAKCLSEHREFYRTLNETRRGKSRRRHRGSKSNPTPANKSLPNSTPGSNSATEASSAIIREAGERKGQLRSELRGVPVVHGRTNAA